MKGKHAYLGAKKRKKGNPFFAVSVLIPEFDFDKSKDEGCLYVNSFVYVSRQFLSPGSKIYQGNFRQFFILFGHQSFN